MATVSDYLGKSLGDFTILDQLGHGAEAEVLSCRHDSTSRVYVLRLDVSDDRLWEGPPLIPPSNATLEMPNAAGTWSMAPQYYSHTLAELRRDPEAWKLKTAAVYGVLDDRYLVPVASPVRVTNAWDVDRVLKTSPADDILYFGLWEEIVLTMILGAQGRGGDAERWQRQHRHLIGGTILHEAMKEYLQGGSLSTSEKQQVLENISGGDGGLELAQNLLLRLCGCASRGRMSLHELSRTLACMHFRINIGLREAQQLLDVYQLLRTQSLGSEESLSLLHYVLTELAKPPLDEFEDASEFQIQEEQPSTQPFNLFLQELAGTTQEVLTLRVTKDA